MNPIFIVFFSIFLLIPLISEIVLNFHLGGLDLFIEFISAAVNPNFQKETILITVYRINQTIIIASISWIISIIFGAILGILSSNIFYVFFEIPIFIKKIIILLLTILRSVHEFVWGLILIQIFGINYEVGIISICIPYAAINAKVIREQLNNINPNIIKAIQQINGNNLASLLTIVWSPILDVFKNFGIYRFECSLRSTAILGLLGVGGIGTSIFLSFQSLNFRELWVYLWSLALLIIFTKILIYRIKLNTLKIKITLCILIITLITFLILTLNLFYFSLNDGFFSFSLFNLSEIFNFDFIYNRLLKAIFETIILSLLSTGIAISLPPFLLLIFNSKLSIFILRILAFWIRTIPPPIIILSLLLFNKPSISLASITLGIYNAAIIFTLLNKNIKNINKKDFEALISMGASKRISWLYGLFNKQIKSYLSYCAYRSDILIRETAIIGVIGGVGLGWQLRESLSSFDWTKVIIILTSYSSIAIIGELINDKIIKKLI